MRDCGGCAKFQKINGDFGGGICGHDDVRTLSDNGRKCKDFKAPKHDRLATKRQGDKLIKVELHDRASWSSAA